MRMAHVRSSQTIDCLTSTNKHSFILLSPIDFPHFPCLLLKPYSHCFGLMDLPVVGITQDCFGQIHAHLNIFSSLHQQQSTLNPPQRGCFLHLTLFLTEAFHKPRCHLIGKLWTGDLYVIFRLGFLRHACYHANATDIYKQRIALCVKHNAGRFDIHVNARSRSLNKCCIWAFVPRESLYFHCMTSTPMKVTKCWEK